MFVSVKKRTLLWGMLLLLGVTALLFCGVFHQQQMAKEAVSAPLEGKVIVIDPGHGGFDAGASANDVTEKDINLAVALRLKACVEQGGGTAVLTRETDVSTAPEDTQGQSAKKADLTARKNLAQSAGADMFVSVHMNKFPQSQYKGAQVFYAATPTESQRLGETIQASLKEVLSDGNERMAKKTDGSIFILKDTTVPSVIVECGFLSNPEEAVLLQQEDYQEKLAQAIYQGLARFNE